MMYVHKDWPRDLIHKESGKRKEFKRPEDVPPGWFTVDGEEVNPARRRDPRAEIIADILAAEEVVRMTPKEPYEVPADQVTGFETFPKEPADHASEQALRTVRGGGSDPQPRRKGRGKRHPKPDRGNPDVSSDEDAG